MGKRRHKKDMYEDDVPKTKKRSTNKRNRVKMKLRTIRRSEDLDMFEEGDFDDTD